MYDFDYYCPCIKVGMQVNLARCPGQTTDRQNWKQMSEKDGIGQTGSGNE